MTWINSQNIGVKLHTIKVYASSKYNIMDMGLPTSFRITERYRMLRSYFVNISFKIGMSFCLKHLRVTWIRFLICNCENITLVWLVFWMFYRTCIYKKSYLSTSWRTKGLGLRQPFQFHGTPTPSRSDISWPRAPQWKPKPVKFPMQEGKVSPLVYSIFTLQNHDPLPFVLEIFRPSLGLGLGT